MKNEQINLIFCTLVFICRVFISNAQAPQGIPYQAVVRNVDGTVMSSTAISITFKIHDVAAT